MDVELSDGSYLIAGKTMTGFADVEEEAADAAAGQKIMPWHIEDAAKERGANYMSRAGCGRRTPCGMGG